MAIKISIFLGFVAFALICWTDSSGAQLDFERADRETVRLQPTHFVGVPKTVKATLSGLGCRIPQPWGTKKPHNLIRGEFMEAGRPQWAALCSRIRLSAIIVIDKNAEFGPNSHRSRTWVFTRYWRRKDRLFTWVGPVGADFILFSLPGLWRPEASSDQSSRHQ